MRISKTQTRKELYDLVWTTPMVQLAKEFGLSDNGLKKKCEKHNIPRPPQGYWVKLEHGHDVPQTPLTEVDDSSLETIEFYEPIEVVVATDEHKASPPRHAREEFWLETALDFKYPEKIHKYHPLIRKCRTNSKGKIYNRYGHVSFWAEDSGIDVTITKGMVDRVSKFLHVIIMLFGSMGWRLETRSGSRGYREYAAFVFEDEELQFKIKEPVKQSLHVKTEKEKNDKYFWGPKYDYKPSGELEFSISNIYSPGFKTTWKDSKKEQLEDQIAAIVQGFSRAFEYKRLRTIEHERERKIREEEEQVRAERQHLYEIQQKREEQLFELVTAQKTTNDLRSLINAFKTEDHSEEFSEWLKWAEDVADSVDPIKNRDQILDRFNKVAG